MNTTVRYHYNENSERFQSGQSRKIVTTPKADENVHDSGHSYIAGNVNSVATPSNSLAVSDKRKRAVTM